MLSLKPFLLSRTVHLLLYEVGNHLSYETEIATGKGKKAPARMEGGIEAGALVKTR
jgi:hypothetical protein